MSESKQGPWSSANSDVHVFTDESCVNAHPYMLIGGLWMRDDAQRELRQRIAEWRGDKWSAEMKFKKCSVASLARYQQFCNLFFNCDKPVYFRCIVVESGVRDDKSYSDGDAELGFYKFYYQLLSRKIRPGNRYYIKVDHRCNRSGSSPLGELCTCINRWSRRKYQVHKPVVWIRPADSKKDDLIQLSDVLLGAVARRWNNANDTTAKAALADHVQSRVGFDLTRPTLPSAKPFNIWKWTPEA